jgi:hypothetical protein
MKYIYLKKERDRADETVWIAEEYLLKKCELNEGYLRLARNRYKQGITKGLDKDILPDTGQSWRYGKIGKVFYYDFDRIPDKLPSMYRSQLGSRKEVLKAKPEKHEDLHGVVKYGIEQALEVGFKEYLHCYMEYKDDHREKLAKACAVVTVLRTIEVEYSIGEKDNKFWMLAGEILEGIKVSYIPSNYRRLKEKIRMTGEKAIAEVIDLPRVGNQNTRQFDDKEVESWVFQLRSMGENYPNIWITRKVQQMCILTGKKAPSEGWFSSIFAKPVTKFLTAEGRFGKTGRKAQVYQGYIPIENAVFAGDCWHVDATRVNMIPYLKKSNLNGKDVMKEEFMQMIVIKDVYSGDVMGRHMDVRESALGYITAVMLAAKEQGYLPYEIVFDRFPGHNTEEWKLVTARMESFGVKVTVTHKAMGKAKLERFFGTLQTVFMTDSKYYYGEGIISNRKYAHRSSEYLYNLKKAARAAGWNFDEAWNEINKVIERFRATPYSEYSRKYKLVEQSPKELHEQSDKPHVIKLAEHELCLLFGLSKTITMRHIGLITTDINCVPYNYEVSDYSVLSKYANAKVQLVYDFEDLNKVYLFEIGTAIIPRFICSAALGRSAQIYGPDANFSTLGKAKARIATIQGMRTTELNEVKQQGNEVSLLLGALGSKEDTNLFEDEWMSASNYQLDADIPNIAKQEDSLDDDGFLFAQM